jgi:hypothetical protein
MSDTSSILDGCISFVSATAGGGLVVALHNLHKHRHPARRIEPDAPEFIDPRIDEAASLWAVTHGRPEARDVIARKLNLAYRLSHRHHDRRWLP